MRALRPRGALPVAGLSVFFVFRVEAIARDRTAQHVPGHEHAGRDRLAGRKPSFSIYLLFANNLIAPTVLKKLNS